MKIHPNFAYISLAISPLACANTGDIGTYILMSVSYLIAIVVALLVFLLSAIYYCWKKIWSLKMARGIAISGAVLSLICFCLSCLSAFDHSAASFPIITGLMFLICIGLNYAIKLVELKVNNA